MPDSIIGTENIKTCSFTTPASDEKYYYGLYIKNESNLVVFKSGVNIT